MVAQDMLDRAEARCGPLRLVPVLECGRGFEHIGPRLTGDPGERWVPLRNLEAPEDIRRLALSYRPGIGDDDPVTGGLPGGHALFAGDELLTVPTCCGELGDVYPMAELLDRDYSRTTVMAGWMELWVGHPVWVVHLEGEHLFLSAGVEPDAYSPTAPEPGKPIWRLPLAAFLGAARLALAEVEAAVPRWQAAFLTDMSEENARMAARGLLGLVPPDTDSAPTMADASFGLARGQALASR